MSDVCGTRQGYTRFEWFGSYDEAQRWADEKSAEDPGSEPQINYAWNSMSRVCVKWRATCSVPVGCRMHGNKRGPAPSRRGFAPLTLTELLDWSVRDLFTLGMIADGLSGR